MIEVYQKPSVVPFVVEKLGNNVTLDAPATGVVLANLETAHARRVDILLTQTQANGIGSLLVRSFAQGRLFSVQYQIHGAIAALTHSICFGEPYNAATNSHALGDTIDIVVTNTVANNTIRCWAIARP